MRLFGRPFLALCAGVIALLGTLAGTFYAAAPPVSAGPLVPLTSSAAPRLPAGAVRLGMVSADMTMHLNVTLNIRDLSGLTALANGLANRNSPYFHDFLTPAEEGALFGPTLAQVAAVRDALAAAGLTPGQVAPNRLTVPVTATAAQVERAFGISLASYRIPGGRVAYANTSAPRLPASVAPLVSGVLGLDDLYQLQDNSAHMTAPASRPLAAPQSRMVPAAAGPQPCLAAANQAVKYSSFTTNQIALHYGLSGLYQLGDLGKGVRVAVAEFQPNRASDVTAYEQCYGIHTAVKWTSIDGGVNTGAGTGEASLDIELIASLAPEASIDVYQTPNTFNDFFDLFNHFVNSNDNVLSVSWGACEPDVGAAYLTDYANAILQANAAGKTVVAATGDSGSTACYPSDTAKAAELATEAPATSPFAIAAGGTTLQGDAPMSPESAWNRSSVTQADGGGAGGGGLSVQWCMAKYQYQPAIPGLVSADSETNTGCTINKGKLVRQVPDLSVDADPFTGYVIYFNGNWVGGWGGTSAAATVLSAIAALVDASPFCADYHAGDAGLLPQDLYGFVAIDPHYEYLETPTQIPEVLEDITSGTNDYTPSGYTAGLYPATKGYDMATGLGVPLVSGLNSLLAPSTYMPGLAAKMCWALGTNVGKKPFLAKVTSVTPSAGPAGRATTVTVHGTGFLPIAGADMAKIFTSITKPAYIVPADCKSATECTVRLPALSARTVDVQISSEDFAYSVMTAADHFQYVGAPHISSVSSAAGAPGATITITGSNFIDVRAVHFGGSTGTGLHVVSATEITVNVPSGSGTVSLTVTAAGGTSNSVSFTIT